MTREAAAAAALLQVLPLLWWPLGAAMSSTPRPPRLPPAAPGCASWSQDGSQQQHHLLTTAASSGEKEGVAVRVDHPVLDPSYGLIASMQYSVVISSPTPIEFLLELPSDEDSIGDMGPSEGAAVYELGMCPGPSWKTLLAGRMKYGKARIPWTPRASLQDPSSSTSSVSSSDATLSFSFRFLRGPHQGVIRRVRLVIPFREGCIGVLKDVTTQVSFEELASVEECAFLVPARPHHALELTPVRLKLRGGPGMCSGQGLEILPLPQEAPSDLPTGVRRGGGITDSMPTWAIRAAQRLKSSWGDDLGADLVTPPTRICGILPELEESEKRVVWPGPALLLLHVPGGWAPGETFQLATKPIAPCSLHVGYHGGVVRLRADILPATCWWTFSAPKGRQAVIEVRFITWTPTSTSPRTRDASDELDAHDARDIDECPQNTGHVALRDGLGKRWLWCDGGDRKHLAGQRRRALSKTSQLSLSINRGGGDTAFSFSEIQLRFRWETEPLENDCSDGWVKGPPERPNTCFWLEEQTLAWQKAQDWCVAQGGDLAHIPDAATQSWLEAIIQESAGFNPGRTYWIGASDRQAEGAFRWVNGAHLTYTNWFPGWAALDAASLDDVPGVIHGSQPSDDGLGSQDCVELRRRFPALPGGKMARTASHFYWNDAHCGAQNSFVCSRPLSAVTNQGKMASPHNNCNRSFSLSAEQPRVMLTSPGYPSPYPDGLLCVVLITAPVGMRLTLKFDDFRIEGGTGCPYDYLEAEEIAVGGSPANSTPRKWCGDWSDRLKLLQFTTKSITLKLTFVSDVSHHFEGFKALVVLENADDECPEGHLKRFGRSCFLFVAFPEVTWHTAEQICLGMKASLASISSDAEEAFLTRHLVASPDFTRRALFWLGAKVEANDGNWRWTDGSALNYSGWSSSPPTRDDWCLSIQWSAALAGSNLGGGAGRQFPWQATRCSLLGGYVCRRDGSSEGLLSPSLTDAANRTLKGSGGTFSSPNFPAGYYPRLHYSIHMEGPPHSKLLVHFTSLDIERQTRCLYDYIELDDGMGQKRRLCGRHDGDLTNLDFVAQGPNMTFTFHSDWSVSGSGFSAVWRAVDISGCPETSMEATLDKDSELRSPNFPFYYLEDLTCSVDIRAPEGHRVWIRFSVMEVGTPDTFGECDLQDDYIQVQLGPDSNTGDTTDKSDSSSLLDTINLCGNLTGQPLKTSFLSYGSRLVVKLVSHRGRIGRGLQALFRAETSLLAEIQVMLPTSTSPTPLHHLNFPLPPPPGVRLQFQMLAPLDHVVQLHVQPALSACSVNGDGNDALAHDPFGTSSPLSLCSLSPAPLELVSHFHWLILLHVTGPLRQRTLALNAEVQALPDPNFRAKVLAAAQDGYKTPDGVDTCVATSPGSCSNGGRCVADKKKNQMRCRCKPQYTGLFCALSACDLNPCLFGTCELLPESPDDAESPSGFRCRCQPGFSGGLCDRRKRPCDGNPCEGRGDCEERNHTFVCRCHAWWEGTRCERRMTNIRYKPLSQRMLEEPFWLGLITVTAVLAAIGLVWCLKRHFPEKLERLLAEDDKARGRLSPTYGGGLSTASPAPPCSPPPQRSLLSRLGLRKPSLLSLASVSAAASAASTPQAHESSRTFSLDDLLRPRRSPSPRQRRHLSAPAKRNSVDRRQLLQQLVAPPQQQQQQQGTADSSRRCSAESIPLRERRTRSEGGSQDADGLLGESTLGLLDDGRDFRAEKKVTFAQLLDRVSMELSSSNSDLSGGGHGSPSRPPLRRCEAQEEADLESCPVSDPATPDTSRPPRRLTKISSADSILHLLRSLTGGTRKIPSAPPSPQGSEADDLPPTPTLLSTPGSPRGSLTLPLPEATLQVPVVDSFTGNLTQSVTLEVPRDFGACLSPIREVPTPLPTPAHTPLLPRAPPRSEVSDADPRPPAPIPPDSDSESAPEDTPMVTVVVEAPSDQPDSDSEALFLTVPAVPSIMISANTSDESDAEHRASSSEPPPSPSPSPSSGSTTPRKTLAAFDSAPRSRSQSFEVAELQLPVATVAPTVVTTSPVPNQLEVPGKRAAPAIFLFPPKTSASKTSTSSEGMPTTLLSPLPPGTRNNSGSGGQSAGSGTGGTNHAPSESNLSSSGYSSLASPAPSRCGSTNPLCNDADDYSKASTSGPARPAPSSPLQRFTVATALVPAAPTLLVMDAPIKSIPVKLSMVDSPDEGFEGDASVASREEASPSLLTRPDCASSRSESPLSAGAQLAPPSESDGAYDASSGVVPTRPPPGQWHDRRSTSPATSQRIGTTSPSHARPPRRRRRPLPADINASDASSESSGGSDSTDPSACPVVSLGISAEEAITSPVLSSRNRVHRLRAITHQIRFLRRLEQSLRRRNSGGALPSTVPLLPGDGDT